MNLCTVTEIQHCHSRESGNLWPDISTRDTILVRTKTRRRVATSLCLRAFVRTILPIDVIGPSLRWGDLNIRLRTPKLQHCHSRESGNPWPDLSARDTILVRTKTRRRGATSLCLHVFVRTILPIDVIGPSLRWGDQNIRLRTPKLQHCHSRESGNPWPDISTRDTILVRTKTRRPGATSLCLRAFVRTILPIVPSMG